MRTIHEVDHEDIEGIYDEKDAEHHSLPNPAEINVGENDRASTCRFLSIICLSFTILIGLAVGLGVGLTVRDNGETFENAGSVTGNSASDIKRRIKLERYLVKHGVTAEEYLNDASSPQSRALDFLAYEDQQKLAEPSGDLTSKRGYSFLTRYVMTVFFYAMDGDNWNFDLLFLSKHDTCLWYSVFPPPVGQLGVICNKDTNEITGFSFIGDNLSGELPKEISHLTTLSYMESIGNKISGSIPFEFSSLTNLRTMVFAWNKLSGPIPVWLDRLHKLQYLILSNNNFSGTIPQDLQALTQLNMLSLNDNLLDGPLDVVWELPNLKHLFLEDNLFTDELPLSISTVVPALVHMDISNNNLVGSIPEDIFDLAALQILDLHSNGLGGAIPSANEETDSVLEFVAFQENQLMSTIPTSLSVLSSLKHLDLSNNNIYGTIPILSSLSELSYLFLAENDFTPGLIPNFLFTFPNLKELSLKGTQRNGPIPDLFKLLETLVVLDLDNNQLTGTLSTELGTLKKLQFLLLNRNKLSNSVPYQYSGMTSLRMILLNGNDITGSLDPICQIQSLEVAVSDCGTTQCSCCKPCCNSTENCHHYDQVASYDPTWATSYERNSFIFSDDHTFPIPDV